MKVESQSTNRHMQCRMPERMRAQNILYLNSHTNNAICTDKILSISCCNVCGVCYNVMYIIPFWDWESFVKLSKTKLNSIYIYICVCVCMASDLKFYLNFIGNVDNIQLLALALCLYMYLSSIRCICTQQIICFIYSI